MGLNAEQVFIQRLVESAARRSASIIPPSCRFTGIGIQRIRRIQIGLAPCFFLDAGVVVIGKHQAHAADMHGKGVVQRGMSGVLRRQR